MNELVGPVLKVGSEEEMVLHSFPGEVMNRTLWRGHLLSRSQDWSLTRESSKACLLMGKRRHEVTCTPSGCIPTYA